jgi:hypothetical protein
MSPYNHPLEPLTDFAQYLRKNTKDFSMTFLGESLELRIPLSFRSHGVLVISDTGVTTPGIMDMIIDDKYHVALNILGSITIVPTDISQMTYNGIEYLVLKLKKGDTFMTSYRVLQDQHIVYVLWTEWITAGKLGYWIDYKAALSIFENVVELTGSGIGVSRSVYEAIIAHLARDPNNPSVQYRRTDMTKPMRLVPLKSVSLAPSGTIARLNGSYFADDGLTSALRYQVDQKQPFENLLRGVPSTVTQRPSDSAI